MLFQIALLGSIYLSANIVAYYPAGLLADTFGRKVAIGASLFIFGACLLVGAFMPSYPTYLASRYFCAIGNVERSNTRISTMPLSMSEVR